MGNLCGNIMSSLQTHYWSGAGTRETFLSPTCSRQPLPGKQSLHLQPELTPTWRHMGGGKWVKSISSLKVSWVRAGHLNSDNPCREVEPSRVGWAHTEQFLRQRNLIRSGRMSHTSTVPWVKSISVSESQDRDLQRTPHPSLWAHPPRHFWRSCFTEPLCVLWPLSLWLQMLSQN